MSADDVDIEPIPGLPEALPDGEHILWQGRPAWRELARTTFYVRGLLLYFCLLTVARGTVALFDGEGLFGASVTAVVVLPFAILALAILVGVAWLHARATLYTITNKRIVMRFGVAFPMTFNLPFKRLAAAELRKTRGGHGDIAVQLSGPRGIAFAHLWPHARPWRLKRAEPMLLSVPDAAGVAARLGAAVRAYAARGVEVEPVLAPAAPELERAPRASDRPPLGVGPLGVGGQGAQGARA